MKKRILLLAVLVIVMLFAFTVCASAETITYEGNEIDVTRWFTAEELIAGTAKVGETPVTLGDLASKLGNSTTDQEKVLDDDSIVVVADSTGTLYAYPSYYILFLTTGDGYMQVSETDYDFLNAYSGKSFSRGAVRYIAFPEGLTAIRNNGVWGRGTHYEVNTTEVVIPKSATIIRATAFSNNTTLKKVYIRAGNQITAIEDYAFEGCTSLEYVQLENLTELTSIDGFANSKKLSGDLDLSKNKQLKTIGNNAFLNTAYGKITLPDSVESIGAKAFCGSNFYFASPYLPSSLKTVGNEFLSLTNNLNSLLIFPVGVTSIDDEGFSGCRPADASQTFTIVFLGKMTKVFIDGHSYTNWGSRTYVYFAQNSLDDVMANVYSYKDKAAGTLDTIIRDNKSTGTLNLDIATQSPQSLSQVGENFITLYFCNDNGKVETSHILTNEGNDITEDRETFVMEGHTHFTPAIPTCNAPSSCIVCDILQKVDHAKGSLIEITYPNGYTAVGNMVYNCTVCDNSFADEGKAEAIYSALGYSYKLDGSGEIMGGYKINTDALVLWQENNGEHNDTLVIGVIIFNPTKLGEQTEFISTLDGKATITNGCVQVEADTSIKYKFLNFKISGFKSATYSSLELVFAGYAYEKDNISTISYAQTSYNQGDTTPIADTYERGNVTLHSVTAELVDMLDGVADGITE